MCGLLLRRWPLQFQNMMEISALIAPHVAVLLLAPSTMHLFAGSITASRRVVVIAFLSLLYYKAPKMSSYIGILPITHSSFSPSTEFVIKLLLVLQTAWHNKTLFSLRVVISCGFEFFLFQKTKQQKNPLICVVSLCFWGEKLTWYIRDYCILLKKEEKPFLFWFHIAVWLSFI